MYSISRADDTDCLQTLDRPQREAEDEGGDGKVLIRRYTPLWVFKVR